MGLSRKKFKAWGRAGGKKGAPARQAALSPERRKEIASIAAKARWAKVEEDAAKSHKLEVL
jgi:hypothetical protein